MKWISSKKTGDFLILANGIVVVILLNLLSTFFFVRWDLTDEKRYTIKPQTKALLRNLEEDVFIEVFLEGDLNPGFKRFRKAIQQTLDEFKVYSNNKVNYQFTDPIQAKGEGARNEFMRGLAAKGITPTNVVETKNGQRVEGFVFPGALVNYDGFETGVMLFKGSRATNPQETLNQSIEGVEFELANAIYKVANTDRKKVGIVQGHGELDSLEFASLNNALLEQYDVFKVDLSRKPRVGDYHALVIAKPQSAFSDQDKYKLDQYLMKGGNLLFLLDRLEANMDSASRDDYFAFPYNLNLDDQLFKYGVRINPDLIQDRVSGKYPIVIGNAGNRPQMMKLDWPFFPLINQYADHAITRNLDATLTRFVSSIDTVKALGVKKTPLLFSSNYSRKLVAPVKVGVNDLRKLFEENVLTGPQTPIAYLLEGKFSSLYRNRFAPEGVDTTGFLPQGKSSRVIVVADGDIARNDVNRKQNQPQQLGFDPISNYTFANQDLLLNMIAYLTDENGLINARNKEIKIRPLDQAKVNQDRLYWQVLNLVVPIVLVIVLGIVRAYWRRRKYAHF